MPYLTLPELSRGVVTRPLIMRSEPASGYCGVRKPGKYYPPCATRDVVVQSEERAQCEEAMLNRQNDLWECLRTGDPCGYGDNPACREPATKTTYVESLEVGIEKKSVTSGGKIIYDEPKGGSGGDGGSSGASGGSQAKVAVAIILGVAGIYLLMR